MKCLALLAAAAALTACPARPATTEPAVAEAAKSDAALRVREVGKGDGVVVLLHGWGASGDDLVPLGERLSKALPLRFLMPEAPLARARGGREWFSLTRGGTDADRATQIAAARKKLVALIDRTVASGVPRERIWLGGFSQGAMMSLDFAAHEPPIGGYLLMSGRALPADGYARLKGVPVLVSHGRSDTVLEFDKGERIRRTLEAVGARVTWVPFDGGHTMPPPVIDGVIDFLRKHSGA